MLPHAPVEIACHANIKAARVAAHDVNPSTMLNHTGKVARSFDSGSVQACGETKFPLALAQDDGFLTEMRSKRRLSQTPTRSTGGRARRVKTPGLMEASKSS